MAGKVRSQVKKVERKGQFKINRFPIAQIIHYAMAKKLYGNDRLAKAMGYASAVFYAMAKKGFYRKDVKKVGGRAKNNEFENPNNLTVMPLGKLAFKIEGDAVIFGKERITAEDYDKALMRKLDYAEILAIHKKAEEYVKDIDHKKVFDAYKKVRDEWRTWEFWDELMKKEIEKVEVA